MSLKRAASAAGPGSGGWGQRLAHSSNICQRMPEKAAALPAPGAAPAAGCVSAQERTRRPLLLLMSGEAAQCRGGRRAANA